jgi:hypothetical protein
MTATEPAYAFKMRGVLSGGSPSFFLQLEIVLIWYRQKNMKFLKPAM